MKRKDAASLEAQVSRLGPLVEAVVAAALNGPGSTTPDLRRRAWDAATAAEPFDPYLAKVRHHAYRVVDGDVEVLTANGLDDDGIFELTVAAALGEAQRRLQAGLAALRG